MSKREHGTKLSGTHGKATPRKRVKRVKRSKRGPLSAGKVSAIILASGEGPTVFGQAPAVHLRKMLTDSGVSAILSPGEALPAEGEAVLVWNGAAMCSKAMLYHMIDHRNFLLEDERGERLVARVEPADREAAEAWLRGDEGDAPGGLAVSAVSDFGTIYNRTLRKSEVAFCAVVTPENLAAVEKRVYLSTYKGVTDLVTKYVWPVPALFLTRWFLRFGLVPNMVTFVGVACMFAAMYLFWEGQYGLGLLAGWVMALLDTVDGKMARVSHTSSDFGNVLDHGMDLIHPPFWYLAWAMGLAKVGNPLPVGWLEPLVWWIFASYIIIRVIEGYFIRRFSFHIHVWRRFDSFFRLIVSRRNPNLILLTVMWAVGRPDLGLMLVAAWQSISLVVHVVQSLQAEWGARKVKLRSWLQVRAEIESSN